VDWDREARFDGYRSFALAPRGEAERPGGHPLANELTRQRLRDEVGSGLARRGYEERAFEQAELWVRIGLRFERRAHVGEFSPMGDPWDDLGTDYPWWLDDDETLVNGNRYTHVYDQATVLIEIFDAARERLVWSGWATLPAGSPERFAEKLPEAVDELLARFPPEPGRDAR
jgi:hypothetical protein